MQTTANDFNEIESGPHSRELYLHVRGELIEQTKLYYNENITSGKMDLS